MITSRANIDNVLKMLLNDDPKEIVPLMYEKIREFPERWK